MGVVGMTPAQKLAAQVPKMQAVEKRGIITETFNWPKSGSNKVWCHGGQERQG